MNQKIDIEFIPGSMEYCETRIRQPYMGKVKVKEDGIERIAGYEAVFNHDFDVEKLKFIKKTDPYGNPWNYKKHDFDNPVIDIRAGKYDGTISEMIRKEFEKIFNEQREKEGW